MFVLLPSSNQTNPKRRSSSSHWNEYYPIRIHQSIATAITFRLSIRQTTNMSLLHMKVNLIVQTR